MSRSYRLRETRRLPGGGGKITISQTATTPFAKHELLAVFGQVGNQPASFIRMNRRRPGHLLFKIDFDGALPSGQTERRPFAGGKLE